MASLNRRIERLETIFNASPCPECGDDDSAADGEATYQVTWIDPGGPEDREEFCEECGRQLVYVVSWGDETL